MTRIVLKLCAATVPAPAQQNLRTEERFERRESNAHENRVPAMSSNLDSSRFDELMPKTLATDTVDGPCIMITCVRTAVIRSG